MALINDSFSAKLAFFHSFNLASTSGDSSSTGMVLSQAIAKSNHSIASGDVKILDIPFAATEEVAKTNCYKIISYDESTKTYTTTNGSNTNNIITFYDKVPLTMITGSNKQGYYFAGEDGTGYVDKWISPLDSLNGFSQSSGYAFKLYPIISGVPTLVDGTSGAFLVNYNNGLICIQSTQVPGKGEASTWTDLRASFFVYSGKTLATASFSPEWETLP